MTPNFWNTVSAVSTLIGSIVVSVTAILAYFQLKEMAQARSLEAIHKVFDDLTNEEMSKARRFVANCKLSPPGQTSPEEYEQMHRVWVSFDNLGILVYEKMIPERIAMEMFCEPVIRYWLLLEPYIDYERQKRQSKYQRFFEDLFYRSINYRNRYWAEKKDASVVNLVDSKQ